MCRTRIASPRASACLHACRNRRTERDMDQPVKVIAKVIVRPDATTEMRAVLLDLAEESRKEAGCESFDVLQNTTEPHVFVLVAAWMSAAALDAHNKTPHVAESIVKGQRIAAVPMDIGRYVKL